MKPQRLVIDGDTWECVYFNKLADVDKYGEDSCWGQCDFSNQTIRLFNGMTEMQTLKTITHEALHVLSGARNIQCLQVEKNHGDLDNIAVGLVNFFSDNGYLEGGQDAKGRAPKDTNTRGGSRRGK